MATNEIIARNTMSSQAGSTCKLNPTRSCLQALLEKSGTPAQWNLVYTDLLWEKVKLCCKTGQNQAHPNPKYFLTYLLQLNKKNKVWTFFCATFVLVLPRALRTHAPCLRRVGPAITGKESAITGNHSQERTPFRNAIHRQSEGS
jgi:hypothetical protein